MKVLYVDQFGKTSGCYTLPQANYIWKYEAIDITEYISDNTDLNMDKYEVPIVFGFHGAYEGNAIHKATSYLKALVELEEYVKENKIDVLHLQWFSLPWIEWLFVKRLRKFCKIMITVHDVIPFNNRPLEMSSLDLIYKNSDYILFHTEYAKTAFEKYYKSRKKTKIITQGFCLKSDYVKLDKKQAKQHFGIPEESVVFLYYGTIRESKGLDILIKAISAAHSVNKNVFLLAGGAFQKVDEEFYLKMTRELLDESFSSVNYSFIPTEEEQWYFSAADVLCLPYREITQSGVAQNGLMYELPMISSDIGEMKEVTRQGINGELIEANREDILRDSILKLAGDNELINRYSEGSKLLAENEFSLERKAKLVAEAYRELVGNSQ